MRKNVEERFILDYGQLEGTINITGPLETAALIRGYSDFLIDLIRNPKHVHQLLRKVNDTLLSWIKFFEKFQGTPLSRL